MRTVNKYIVVFSVIVFLFSCEKDTTSFSMNDTRKDINKLKTNVLYKGDSIDSYYFLRIEYLEYKNSSELLLYALVMANKYDNTQGYFDVFLCLSQIYNGEIDSIDEKTAKLAMTYFREAANKGHEQASELMEKLSYRVDTLTYKQQIECLYSYMY